MKRILLLVFVLFLMPSLVSAAEFKDAMIAYENREFEKAAEIFQTLADAGNLMAKLNLGRMYQMGRGVPASGLKAVSLYEEVAKEGDLEALVALAGLYQYGEPDVPQDTEKALQYYLKAAGQGSEEAQIEIGRMYQDGSGSLQADRAEADKWLYMAAQQGGEEGLSEYADWIDKRKGSERNAVEVYVYTALAVQKGAVEMESRLAELKAELTPDQLKDAEKQIAAWTPCKAVQLETQP